jgi:hypothetical protein
VGFANKIVRLARDPTQLATHPVITARLLTALCRAGIISNETALTCCGKADGGGAQIQARMSVIAFCKAMDLHYVHTPIQRVERAAGKGDAARWEALFRLGMGEPSIDNIAKPSLPLHAFLAAPRRWQQPVVIQTPHLHPFTDAQPDIYAKIGDELRLKYAGKPPVRTPSCLSIALHIRRGDVTLQAHPLRYTSDSKIRAAIGSVIRTIERSGYACQVAIYSEGVEQDFSVILDCPFELHLNGDPLDALQNMISSDILVMSKSSFSYVAALIHQGPVIYEPFWHRPMGHWHIMGSGGKIHEERLLADITSMRRLPSAPFGYSAF